MAVLSVRSNYGKYDSAKRMQMTIEIIVIIRHCEKRVRKELKNSFRSQLKRIMQACIPNFAVFSLKFFTIRMRLTSLSRAIIFNNNPKKKYSQNPNSKKIPFPLLISPFSQNYKFQYTKYFCIIMQNSNISSSLSSSSSLSTTNTSLHPQVIQMKILLIGEIFVGKTSLIQSYKNDTFDRQYNSTFLQINNAIINYKDNLIKMNIWDLSGSEQYDSTRPLAYGNTDIFLICFSLIDLKSFHKALNKWLPEINKTTPDAIKIFVGTKKDIFDQEQELQQRRKIGLREHTIMAKVKSTGHRVVLCSAAEEESVRLVFHEAIQQNLAIRQKCKKNNQKDCKLI